MFSQAVIVCIEDERDLRELLMEELEDQGYVVYGAGDGVEGLELIKRVRPELILCDIGMPLLDGFSLLATLKKEEPGLAEPPFVFQKAFGDRTHLLAGRQLGADDYLLTRTSRNQKGRKCKGQRLAPLYFERALPAHRRTAHPLPPGS